ncbi:TetR/AcrR family transcriptional regulator [Rhizobium sp. BE258]|uniref:TetR/AcrR family transcriptional regulator n=1 Tax=Rhizobium sp. BE258 TaxID=2817722 RepID=UPI000DDBE137|nr:TetR/AcrR family transcriptional regulator [Rhizobium sp. BE258]MDR7145013.1 AcrR family transcriptional regulator [Rhizobium sp. BE258]
MAVEDDSNSGQKRGPAEHAVRDQIVHAANGYFSHFGYGKTTMNDLAKAIGFSKAYIYKFFDSKQSIGEAICVQCLAKITSAAEQTTNEPGNSAEKMRRYFRTLIDKNVELFFVDRQLYEIATYSTSENWVSSQEHTARIESMVRKLVSEGREAGEFETKTPLDEVSRATMQAMQSFLNPSMLQHNLDAVPNGSNEVISLILRSLSK